LYALKARDGAKLWSYRTGGNGANSSPVVTNGVVYVGGGVGKVYAFGLK
jgi:outer membrane protein assembly factor BamB